MSSEFLRVIHRQQRASLSRGKSVISLQQVDTSKVSARKPNNRYLGTVFITMRNACVMDKGVLRLLGRLPAPGECVIEVVQGRKATVHLVFFRSRVRWRHLVTMILTPTNLRMFVLQILNA